LFSKNQTKNFPKPNLTQNFSTYHPQEPKKHKNPSKLRKKQITFSLIGFKIGLPSTTKTTAPASGCMQSRFYYNLSFGIFPISCNSINIGRKEENDSPKILSINTDNTHTISLYRHWKFPNLFCSFLHSSIISRQHQYAVVVSLSVFPKFVHHLAFPRKKDEEKI
jgi:hypothetical protein